MGRCRSCHADIIWAVTDSGKRMPVDTQPVEGGNVILRVDGAGRFSATVLGPGDQPRDDDGVRYVSHFTTCGDAAEWRGAGST